ncbi:hypothetical protein HHL22_17200 [Hymenobacter sp. RP-2-7]|uniref:Uncharacterized protein n=1 Tax=Hymenobacter polaris TaxID=2682546 RepID=A0A7Y0FNW5_9BACT|nr:hypothetical protein [Hymenobacter polaris]NML66945.1 hypothetical protein [Hymenobacter polaris]
MAPTAADQPEDAADRSPTIDLGDWINTFVLAALPLVGFVLLCAWAFGRTTPPSKANWARAMLLLYALVLVLGLALVALTWLARPADTQVLTSGPGYRVVP